MKDDLELALEVINQKTVKMAKEENQEKLRKLVEEKNEIYKGNKEVIEKVLTEYLEEIKIEGNK